MAGRGAGPDDDPHIRRRSRARPPRSDASDLGPRILVAIPALAFAGLIVGFGHWVFAAGLFVLGAICLHELFHMFAFTNPSRLAGFIGLAGLIVAAEAGADDEHRAEVELQKLTDAQIAELDGLLKGKEAEILEV